MRECQEYADRQGLTVIGTYIDRAMSAKTDDRPEFQRMIQDSAKHQFEVVLVWKLDRFSRNRTDSAMNKVILKRNGVKVVSAKESISEGPEGIILEAMLEGMAEYYSAELAVKVKRGMTDNALKGLWNGGTVPLGYRIDENRKYQIDPLTSPLVLEIYTSYADGETIKAITESLNGRGLRTSRGAAFNKSSMNTLLSSRKYLGEYEYDGKLIPDAIPAIVPRELFDRVQERRKLNKHAPARSKAPVEYLLTTKLFCGECGAYLIGESGTSSTAKRKYHYYKCANAKRKSGNCDLKPVKKDWIERLVVAEAQKKILNDDAVIDQLAETIVKLYGKGSATLPLLQNQLKEVEKGIGNMLDAIQQGILNEFTKGRLDELGERKKDLEIAIAKEQLECPTITKEHVVFFISRFKNGDINDVTFRRRIIDIFVNSVYIYRGRLLLLFNSKDSTETVTFDAVGSSDLVQSASPSVVSPKSAVVSHSSF